MSKKSAKKQKAISSALRSPKATSRAPKSTIACACQDPRQTAKGISGALIFLGILILVAGVLYYFTPNVYTQPVDDLFVFYNSDQLSDEELTGGVLTDFNLEAGTASTLNSGP